MALQKSVGLNYSLGVAGQEVVIGQAKYLSYNPLSDGTVKAGAFCFKKAVTGDGETVGHVSLTGTGAPLGFVERVVDTYINQENADSTEVYPEGAAVTVAIKGQFYIAAPAAISADGLGVFVNPTTGAIAIKASAGTGEEDTGFICRLPNGATTAAAGDIVVIEKI